LFLFFALPLSTGQWKVKREFWPQSYLDKDVQTRMGHIPQEDPNKH